MDRFSPLTVRCQNIARFFVNGQELWRTVMNAKIQFSEEKMQNHEFATVRKSTLRWTHNPLVVGSSPTRPTNSQGIQLDMGCIPFRFTTYRYTYESESTMPKVFKTDASIVFIFLLQTVLA